MNEGKSTDRFATPNSSKLAQILLQLRGVDPTMSIDANLNGIQNNEMVEQYSTNVISDADENGIDNFDDVNIQDSEPQSDHCNCRKSKCLKLYCQCFAAKDFCSGLCRCITCDNKPDKESIREIAVNSILERNPNAFDSKYKPAVSMPNITTVSSVATIAHKNGCRCRKSLCLKKYCECFQGGVTCSTICTCLTCHNTGDSNALIGTIASEDPMIDVSLVKYNSLSIISQHSDYKGDKKIASEETASKTNGITNQLSSSYKQITAISADGRVALSSQSYSKPPLIPSHKRKSDVLQGNDVPSMNILQDHGTLSLQNFVTSENEILPITPSLSREHQQRLLEQLLYQELENQGLLTSPFASLVNLNNPNPFAIQLNTHVELDSGKDSLENIQDCNLYAPYSAPTTGGIRSASPNSINIATALALLAANAQVTQYMHNNSSSTPIDMYQHNNTMHYLKQLPSDSNNVVPYHNNVLSLASNSATTPLPAAYNGLDDINATQGLGLVSFPSNPLITMSVGENIKVIDSIGSTVNKNNSIGAQSYTYNSSAVKEPTSSHGLKTYGLTTSDISATDKMSLVDNNNNNNKDITKTIVTAVSSTDHCGNEEFKQHQSELAAGKENSPNIQQLLNQIIVPTTTTLSSDLNKRIIT